MIIFNPQSVPAIKKRFSLAIIEIYDCDIDNIVLRPGQKPQHIFDYKDGLRLIVSKNKIEQKIVIHFSASFVTTIKNGLYDQLRSFGLKVQNEDKVRLKFKEIVEKRFKELSNFKGKLNFLGFSEGKGVPHWYINIKEVEKNKI